MRVAITGSTGLIGSALTPHLESLGHEVIRIVRGNPSGTDIVWSPAECRIDTHALDGVDAVVHLAGAGIGDKRWTDDYKRELLESRTKGTTLISEAIAAADDGPTVFVSASAIGIYGARGDEELDETSAPGTGFLADVCVQWEAGHGDGRGAPASASSICAPASCCPPRRRAAEHAPAVQARPRREIGRRQAVA